MCIDLGSVKDWTGVVGSLGGAIIGAVIALIVSARQQSHQRRLEAERRLLERYEQLHTLLGNVSSESALCAAVLIYWASSNVPIEPDTVSGEVSVTQLQMLVDFYAPSLNPESAALGTNWSKLFRLAAEVVGAGDPSPERRAHVSQAAAALAKELHASCTSAQQKLTAMVAGLQR